MNKTMKTDERGFTLVEALVALFVLLLAVTPAFWLSSSSVNLAASVRNNLIAANLAQEGIEVIRAMRDRNWFTAQPFAAGLTGGTYQVVWDSDAVAPDADAFLKTDANGVYNYTTGTDSIFKRTITITNVSGVELQVQSQVSWQERNRSKTVSVEAHLFDWK